MHVHICLHSYAHIFNSTTFIFINYVWLKMTSTSNTRKLRHLENKTVHFVNVHMTLLGKILAKIRFVEIHVNEIFHNRLTGIIVLPKRDCLKETKRANFAGKMSV